MTSPLNFFAPYDDLAATHENQLTRGLLVVLRYSPLAHSIWLSQIDPDLHLQRLGAPLLRTQQARVVTTGAGDRDQAMRGISVLLAPDAFRVTSPVRTGDRGQVLDAVAEYRQELVVVIENKITDQPDPSQAVEINTHGANVAFDPAVRVVSWRDLLAALSDVVAQDLVSGAERRLLEDFLEFADHHFPEVGPYSTLRRAGLVESRIRKRLDSVLAEALGMAERTGQGEGWRELRQRGDGNQRAVEMASLRHDAASGSISLVLYPGDTLAQARVLYARPAGARGLPNLQGWSTKTNFHWGFMSSGMCWTRGAVPVEAYVEYWIGRIAQTGQIQRADWAQRWSELEAAGIVRADDRAEFDRRFTNTQIQTATPRPGLASSFCWGLSEAVRLDDDGRFVTAVRDRVLQLLRQVGEKEVADTIAAP